MDQSLRDGLRFLQYLGDFSSLCLDQILDERSLEELFYTVVISRLKKNKIELISFSTYPFRSAPSQQPMDQPQIFWTETEPHLGRYILTEVPGEYNLIKEPENWEQLPRQLLLLLAGIEWTVSQVNSKEKQTFGKVTAEFVNKAVLIHKYPSQRTHQRELAILDFYVACKWRETQESFEATKFKKLREKGLIPGRRWSSPLQGL